MASISERNDRRMILSMTAEQCRLAREREAREYVEAEREELRK